MKRLLIAAVAALCLNGCIVLDNRVTCTVAKDKSFVVSQYGAFGLASQIADADTRVICK